MEVIPNSYFYSMIPYFIFTIILTICAIKEKDIDAWQYAGIIFLIGIMPFNSIILLIVLVFTGSAIVIATLGTIFNWIFNKLTQ